MKNSRANRWLKKVAPLLTGRLDIEAGAPNIVAEQGSEKPSKVSMIAYTGGVMTPKVGNGRVRLVVDLGSAKIEAGRQIPALRDHDFKRVPGYLYAKVQDNQILAEGRLLENPEADDIRAAHSQGLKWQVSIGMEDATYEPIEAGRFVSVNGQRFQGPIFVARNARLREISFLSVGADADTHVSLAASGRDSLLEEGSMPIDPKFAEWLKAGGWGDHESLEDKQLEFLQAAWTTETLKAAGNRQSSLDVEDIVKQTRQVTLAEHRRVGAIQAAAKTYGAAEIEIDGKKVDFVEHAIEAGWSIEAAENAALKAGWRNAPLPRGSSEPAAKLDQDVIEASMLMASGMAPDEVAKGIKADAREKVMNEATGSDFRGMTIQGLLRAAIHSAGLSAGRFGTLDSDSLINLADQAVAKRASLQAAGQFSTISLPGVLGNVARKTMLRQYETASLTWRLIAAPVSLPDFKSSTSYRMDINGRFEKVGQDGELKHVSLQESSRAIRLETQGAMIGLTRQMIINDDLRAFLQIPRMFGRQAAIAIEREVYTVLLAGVDTTLFTTANGNIVEGTANVLGETGLAAGLLKFRGLTDANGDPIMLEPQTLLVSPTLEFTAKKLMNSAETRNTTANTKEGTANVFQNLLRVAISPYVSNTTLGGTGTLYFLLADPDVAPTVEVGFLNGRQTPVIEQERQDFNVLGQLWRAYIDFDAAEADPKGGVAVTGVV